MICFLYQLFCFKSVDIRPPYRAFTFFVFRLPYSSCGPQATFWPSAVLFTKEFQTSLGIWFAVRRMFILFICIVGDLFVQMESDSKEVYGSAVFALLTVFPAIEISSTLNSSNYVEISHIIMRYIILSKKILFNPKAFVLLKLLCEANKEFGNGIIDALKKTFSTLKVPSHFMFYYIFIIIFNLIFLHFILFYFITTWKARVYPNGVLVDLLKFHNFFEKFYLSCSILLAYNYNNILKSYYFFMKYILF